MIELKSGKTSVFDAFCVCVCWRGAWGVNGGWTPLPTRPQQYCNPALHVSSLLKMLAASLKQTMKEYQEFASQNRVFVDEETGARIRINYLLGGTDFLVGSWME